MVNAELILESREERLETVKKYISDYQVVTLKANIPGTNKNTSDAYLLLEIFDRIIQKKNPIKSFATSGFDGKTIYYLFNREKLLKEEMIDIENMPLGRFVDIDCYLDKEKSENRSSMRKCYICDSPAFICIRNKTHSISELTNFIHESIKSELIKKINNYVFESIYAELDLDPKFGLVTKTSNGSHKDMNYSLMVKSIDAIMPFFTKMFINGYDKDNLDEIFSESRKIGLIAESEMLKATSGINTYKGLIFDLGVILSALGYRLSHFDIEKNVFEITKEMLKGIVSEYKCTNTFGAKAYKEYKFGGAREEAMKGFPSVQNALKEEYNLDSKEGIYKALVNLIINSSDSVFLKRSKSMDKYIEIKEMFKQLELNAKSIQELTNYLIKENISFGGSADLLIVTMFINNLNK